MTPAVVALKVMASPLKSTVLKSVGGPPLASAEIWEVCLEKPRATASWAGRNAKGSEPVLRWPLAAGLNLDGKGEWWEEPGGRGSNIRWGWAEGVVGADGDWVTGVTPCSSGTSSMDSTLAEIPLEAVSVVPAEPNRNYTSSPSVGAGK